MSGHTPGPWELRGRNTIVGECGLIADVAPKPHCFEANARLIAAAPEMLAELRACEATLTDLWLMYQGGQLKCAEDVAQQIADDMHSARAAIAKAEGT